MIVGVPKEIKNNEFRVGMVPAGAKAFIAAGATRLGSSNGIAIVAK